MDDLRLDNFGASSTAATATITEPATPNAVPTNGRMRATYRCDWRFCCNPPMPHVERHVLPARGSLQFR